MLAAAFVAFFVALFASGRWDIWLMARNATPFGQVDPILGFDISFYLFQLPLLHFLHGTGTRHGAARLRSRRGSMYFVSQSIAVRGCTLDSP